MKENFESALAAVLHHEGGFVNHPSDPGGMTNLGCTKAVWESWVNHPVSEADMRALKPADVGPLYKAKYWDKVNGDELPAGVDTLCLMRPLTLVRAALPSGCRRWLEWPLMVPLGPAP
jgi:lysozyme family protein